MPTLRQTEIIIESEVEFKGTRVSELGNGVALCCITPEARDLLDTIMKEWEIHLKQLRTTNGKKYRPTHYGFAYWLVRYSGLIQPAKIQQP
jgi:hypothetical protein